MILARLEPGDQMELVRHEMVLAGAFVPPSLSLHLKPLAGPGCYVDGVVHERRVAMVEKLEPPRWMTGVNWHLHPNPNGSWRLVNQNEQQHCLTAMSERLELRPATSVSHWLIYRRKGHDVFCLRSVSGQWLFWRDGVIGLGRRFGPYDETVLWHFHRPVRKHAIEQPRTQSASILPSKPVKTGLSGLFKPLHFLRSAVPVNERQEKKK